MRVGILALQGGFELHAEKIRELGAQPLYVRKPSELAAIDALIVPGGESSTLLHLCDQDFRDEIASVIRKGMPALVTCAGLILFAKQVENPVQESLGLFDIRVRRNAYGRQVDSFITENAEFTESGEELLQSVLNINLGKTFEAVFIRAPKIVTLSDKVMVLAKCGSEPILIRQGKIIGASFHPELSGSHSFIHQLLIQE